MSAENGARWVTAERIAYTAQHGTLQFDKTEFESLPDKQTESIWISWCHW